MSLSNYGEKLLLDFMLTTGTVTRPTAWYVQVHENDPGETGVGSEPVIVGGDWDRRTITFGAAVSPGGTAASTLQVTWTNNAGNTTKDITHISIHNALTAGDCLFVGELAAYENVLPAGVLTFPVGRIVAVLS